MSDLLLQTFLTELALLGLENTSGRFYGVYRGKAKSLRDATKQGLMIMSTDLLVDDAELSQPAYPVSPFAGNGFGFFMPPEKGDDVYISFEMGDPNIPYYVGGWWGKDELPAELSSKVEPGKTRLIKCPSGHLLLFQQETENGKYKGVTLRSGKNLDTELHFLKMIDDPADEKVHLSDREGRELVLDVKNEKLWIKDKLGQIIEMDEKASKITITDVSGDTVVMSPVGIEIESKKLWQLTVATTSTEDVTGAKLVKASTQTEEIQGAMLEKATSSTEQLTAAKVINAASLVAALSGTASITAGAAMTLVAGPAMTLTAVLIALVGVIQLGAAAGGLALVNISFMTAYNANVAIYNGHTHLVPGAATSLAPGAPQNIVDPASVTTKNTFAT